MKTFGIILLILFICFIIWAISTGLCDAIRKEEYYNIREVDTCIPILNTIIVIKYAINRIEKLSENFEV